MSRNHFEKTRKYHLREYEGENQSYAIVDANNILIGSITIDNTEDVIVYLDIPSANKDSILSYVVTSLINYLGSIYYEKRHLILKEVGHTSVIAKCDVDFKKRQLTNGDVEYIIDNRHRHLVLTSLIKEISDAQATLLDWNTYWQEKIYDEDGKVITDANDNLLATDTKMCLFPCLGLNNIVTNHGVKEIYFLSDGIIKYQKFNRKKDINYEFIYNCLENGFNFELKKSESAFRIQINSEGEIHYVSSDSKASFSLELLTNHRSIIRANNDNISYALCLEKGLIRSGLITFMTRKGNGKINAIYQMKINENEEGISLYFISRDGQKYDLIPFLTEVDSYLGTDLRKQKFYIINFNNLMKRLINVCNKYAKSTNHSVIDCDSYKGVEEVLNLDNMGKNILKEIASEIPLTTLQAMVNAYTSDTPEKANYQTRSRVKKRQDYFNMI